MLLGISYHAILFGGGMGAMFGGQSGPTAWVMDWTHSFRMALFFMVGGFFSAMMFAKYSVGTYLAKRWWRLGAAMVIYLFTLVGINQLTGYSGGFGGFGPPRRTAANAPESSPNFAGPPPGREMNGSPPDSFAPTTERIPAGAPEQPRRGLGPPAGMAARPAGDGPVQFGPGDFGPGMFLAGPILTQADTNQDKSVTAEEFERLASTWFAKLDSKSAGRVSQQEFARRFGELLDSNTDTKDGRGPENRRGPGGFNPAIFMAPSFFTALDRDHDGFLGEAEIKTQFGKWHSDWRKENATTLTEEQIRSGLNTSLQAGGFGGPGRGPGGGPGFGRGGPGGPFGGGSPIADRLFGNLARQFNMGPMWFLWFLIVFATVGPIFAWVVGRLLRGSVLEFATLSSRILFRWSLAPLALALVCIPALWFAGTSPGRAPDGGSAIMSVFPDVFFRYHPDLPYFFIFFMTGWLLYQLRSQLNDLGRFWIPCLVIGVGAHLISERFKVEGGPFQPQIDMNVAKRLSLYGVFTISAAFTSFGFIGFFQKHFDRPGRVSRYLADTAFWFYLLHQELLIRVILPALRRYELPLGVQTIVALLLITLIGSITFELVVRRTILTNLFGPTVSRRRERQPVPALVSESAEPTRS